MDALTHQWISAPTWAKLITIAALPATGYAIARFLDEYRDWQAVGPGGLPHDVRGFMANLLLTGVLAKKETKSLEVYDLPDKNAKGWKQLGDEEKAKAKKSYFKAPLEQRKGKESNALHFVAPQRERNVEDLKFVEPAVQEAYWTANQSLGDRNNDAITWKTSVLEKVGQAMFLKDNYTVPTLNAKLQREICHIHESDLSAHVLLSIADARDVVAKGWGERHRITGTVVLPLGYTLLYLPRNLEEVEVMARILEAGVEYAMSNGKSS